MKDCPARLPDKDRKIKTIAFRVTEEVHEKWLEFVNTFVGYKREYGSVCELLDDMMDTLNEKKREVRHI